MQKDVDSAETLKEVERVGPLTFLNILEYG